MQPIKSVISKIRWDKRENPDDCVLYYFDRIQKKLLPLKFAEIRAVEGSFIVAAKSGRKENVSIPLHRVKRVEKRGRVVWERK